MHKITASKQGVCESSTPQEGSTINPLGIPWCIAVTALNSTRKRSTIQCECFGVCGVVWLCERMSEWANEWVSVSVHRVFVYLCKNLHTDLIWSGSSLALLGPEMIGTTLASLFGDEQRARVSPPGLPRFMLWSEVMNWSDILVRASLSSSQAPSRTMSQEAILI